MKPGVPEFIIAWVRCAFSEGVYCIVVPYGGSRKVFDFKNGFLLSEQVGPLLVTLNSL